MFSTLWDQFQYIRSCIYFISKHVLSVSGEERCKGEVNVLLVGSADLRHILKTMAGLQDSERLHVSPQNSCVSLELLWSLSWEQTCLCCVTAGVGGRKQHGGDGQAASFALPGTDAPGKHGKYRCTGSWGILTCTYLIKKCHWSSWFIPHFQRKRRFSLSCLGTARSAARQQRRWNVLRRNSSCLLLNCRKHPHTPVSTQHNSRSH